MAYGTLPSCAVNVITSYSIHYTKLYEVELGKAPTSQGVDIDLEQDTPSVSRSSRPPPKPPGKKGTQRYVASRKGKNIFHLPDCRNAKRIKQENLIVFHSRQEATKNGRTPAKDCKP